ncbi:glycosyl transferase family 29 (putative sialyltransferase) [Albidovulum inexpectatum]|uniref:Glycosyl transferase family 29 (Putative sialyltransferase) n=1 Tax=Albidovulum inexpectatum TaxID=196587 RepID=A0A2S5JLK2_9RHOB|nr:glycosyltransferase family 29 protein [Albidovulum inexpectatum]PPB82312.1 glycosyl transferase family 29 (putative sialyltransferase) [Albidovulum inexpectatum]
MTRLGFLIARTLRQEGPLARLSVPQQSLMDELEGRAVALVGNARSLAAREEGAMIDAADIVIRINRAPMPSARSHGTRTDWLALATSIRPAELDRIAPRRILWMSHKRKRLSWRVAHTPGFYLHPLVDWTTLRDRLGAPPTTGAMMIDLLMRSRLRMLSLHGFDFFASKSLSGSRDAHQVPHDFAAERRMVEDLIARDGRVRLVGA